MECLYNIICNEFNNYIIHCAFFNWIQIEANSNKYNQKICKGLNKLGITYMNPNEDILEIINKNTFDKSYIFICLNDLEVGNKACVYTSYAELGKSISGHDTVKGLGNVLKSIKNKSNNILTNIN